MSALLLATTLLVGLNIRHGAGDEARLLAEAMLIHDKSVETLQIQQEVLFHPDTGMQADEAPGWLVYRDGIFGFHSNGDWYWHGRTGPTTEVPGGVRVYRNVHFTSDSQHCVAWTEENRGGTIEQRSDMVRMMPSPFSALGRWIEPDGSRRLGELLLDAPDLRVVESTDETTILQASVELNDMFAELIVEVDHEHGYAPREVVIKDAPYNCVLEHLHISEFQLVDDVWVPAAGSRTLFERVLTEEMTPAYEAALQRVGYSKENPDPALLRTATLDVFGESGFPVRPLGSGRFRFVVNEIVAVNEPLDEELTHLVIPRDVVLFDAVSGTNTRDHGHAVVGRTTDLFEYEAEGEGEQ